MLDALYVIATLAFFALMIGYIRFCAFLGRTGTAESDRAAEGPQP